MKSLKFYLLVLMQMVLGIQFLSGQTLHFNLSNEVGMPGDTVSIAVTVENFIQLSGYQGTLRWDTAVVDFVDLASPTTGLTNIFGSPGQGLIPLDAATYTWIDFGGGTLSFADSSEVIRIRFEIKANAPTGVSPVTIDGSVTALAYSNGIILLTPTVNQGSVTVSNCTPTADPSFSFPTSLCTGAANPQATILGDLGGRFSVNNGATIDSITGVLDLSSTMPGLAYQITYAVGTPCEALGSQSIQIFNNDDPSFSISDTVCFNSNNPTPSVTGLTGGTFSVNNGASIDPSTGVLDLMSTVAGTTYQISYLTNGPCPDSSLQDIYVQTTEDASFSISDTVCVFDTNPLVSISGVTGGSFTVDQGALIDPATGELFLSSTMAGTTYQISYQTPGLCAGTSTQDIYIIGLQDASFVYPASLCPGVANPLPTITGLSGGSFSVAPSGNVNPLTGELDLTSISSGVLYTITYALNDACQSFSQQQIIIEDNTAPDSLSLPMIMRECSATLSVPSTTDDCAGVVNGTTTDPLTYTAQGTYTVNWTFDDGNGNQTLVSQTVIVQDMTPPTVLCKDFTVSLDSSGMATILASQIDNGSSDSCGIASYTLSQTSFSAADIGQNLVTLYVTDINGNLDSCSSLVTVTNVLPPTAVCQDLTLYLDDVGQAAISATDLDGGSTVNIGSPQLSVDQDSFDCGNVGPNLVSLIVSDSLGGMDTCVAVVTVVDTIAPIVICRDFDIVLDSIGQAIIEPAMVDSGSTDICGILSYSLSRDTFGIADTGEQTVFLTVTDINGNADSCEATINVLMDPSTNSIEDPWAASLRLDVYPNPVEDLLTLEWYSLGFGEIKIEILNPLGQMLQRETKIKGTELLQTQLELNDLPKGMYIVRVQQGDYLRHTQIIKK